MGTRNYDDQESTYRLGESLKAEAGQIRLLADLARRLADQAENDQPVGSSLTSEMRDRAATLSRAADEADTWYERWRRQTRDVQRVEDPRRSQRVEQAADVGRAIRDV